MSKEEEEGGSTGSPRPGYNPTLVISLWEYETGECGSGGGQNVSCQKHTGTPARGQTKVRRRCQLRLDGGGGGCQSRWGLAPPRRAIAPPPERFPLISVPSDSGHIR